jgi:uncharacterized protein (TIGR00290 family)
MRRKILLAWSGGKDSALALHELKKSADAEVTALLTTVTEGFDRISMHGVRRKLLTAQAEALRLPLEEICIPQKCSNEIYEERMRQALEKSQLEGVSATAFGDLFLQEIRSYREKRMAMIGMEAIFPLWDRNTGDLAQEFVRLGFRATIVCVDTEVLGSEFAGREYDEGFIRDLPPGIDPCGENGEFHTFVYDGPIFSKPVQVLKGEKVLRDNRFFYCDLLSPKP